MRNLPGIRTVILPKVNEKNLHEIRQNVRKRLRFVLVEHMDEVLAEALGPAKEQVIPPAPAAPVPQAAYLPPPAGTPAGQLRVKRGFPRQSRRGDPANGPTGHRVPRGAV